MDQFTKAYIECALWSSTDESDDRGGEPMDLNYDIGDLAPECLAKMEADCKDFQESFGEFIALGHDGRGANGEEFLSIERAGHDFWLTRNGHGAGFWDGDWKIPMPILRCEFAEEGGCGWPALCDNCKENQSRRQYADIGAFLTAMSKPYGEVNLYVGDDGMIYS